MMQPARQRGHAMGGPLDELNKSFSDWAATPVGSILIFVVGLIVRFTISERLRKRTHKHNSRRKPA